MKYLPIITFFLFLASPAFSQFSQEKALAEVAEIKNQLSNQKGADISKQLKAFQAVLKTIPSDNQLDKAVIYTKIGQALTANNHPEIAQKYFKKALKYRLKMGDYKPVRWALQSLFDNSLAAKDFKTAEKCTYQWMKHLESHLENTVWQTTVGKKYWDERKPTGVFYGEYIRKMESISLTYQFASEELPEKEREERYKIGEKMFRHFLKSYPKGHTIIFHQQMKSLVPFYNEIITHYLNEKQLEKAHFWEERALKILSNYRTALSMTDHVRYLSVLYRDQGFEDEGIRVMRKYAEECAKLQRYDQVSFTHRYIGLRYLKLKKHALSIQAFADGIKTAIQYEQDSAIQKAYYGIDQVLANIIQAQDSAAWLNAQNWMRGYDLSGLPNKHIETINTKVSNLDFNDYIHTNYSYGELKESQGRMLNGQREGTWTWWYPWSDGQIEKTVHYKNGIKEGKSQFFYRSGKLKQEVYYKNDKLHGKKIQYYENGNKKQEANFENDLPQGDAFMYFEDGQVKAHQEFKNGLLWNLKVVTDEDGNKITDLGTFKDGTGTLKIYDGNQTKLSAMLNYVGGKLHGEFTQYYPNGVVQMKGLYDEGKLVYDEAGIEIRDQKKVFDINCSADE